jgi:Uma2 family endonuclease
VTVEEFRELKDPPGVRLELHEGAVIEVALPNYRNWRLRKRMMLLFDDILGGSGDSSIECPFRPLPEHSLRVANVAWISSERYQRIDDDDNLHGAPDIVVEVLSPSNSASELVEKRDLCFRSGCREFWIVDPKRRFIEVTPIDGVPHVYRGSERIAIGDATRSVDEILDC